LSSTDVNSDALTVARDFFMEAPQYFDRYNEPLCAVILITKFSPQAYTAQKAKAS
jgi:hypothetical protein